MLGEGCPRVLVAGPDWWGSGRVRAAIGARDRLGRIRLIGAVDDATLGSLYAGATLDATSRAEGSGLTCVEAMSAGTPLVAVDIPSVRELVDDAAVLVLVDDVDRLAGEMNSFSTIRSGAQRSPRPEGNVRHSSRGAGPRMQCWTRTPGPRAVSPLRSLVVVDDSAERGSRLWTIVIAMLRGLKGHGVEVSALAARQ